MSERKVYHKLYHYIHFLFFLVGTSWNVRIWKTQAAVCSNVPCGRINMCCLVIVRTHWQDCWRNTDWAIRMAFLDKINCRRYRLHWRCSVYVHTMQSILTNLPKMESIQQVSDMYLFVIYLNVNMKASNDAYSVSFHGWWQKNIQLLPVWATHSTSDNVLPVWVSSGWSVVELYNTCHNKAEVHLPGQSPLTITLPHAVLNFSPSLFIIY